MSIRLPPLNQKVALVIIASLLGLMGFASCAILFGFKGTAITVIITAILAFAGYVGAGIWIEQRKRKLEKDEGKDEDKKPAKPKPGTLTWFALLRFIVGITTLLMVSWYIVSLQDALSEERARSKRNLEVAEQTAYWLRWELGPGEYDPESGKNNQELKVQMVLNNDEELRFIVERQVNGEIRHTLYSLKRDYSKPRSYAGTWTQTEPGGKSGTVFLNQRSKFYWTGSIRNQNGFSIPCELQGVMK